MKRFQLLIALLTSALGLASTSAACPDIDGLVDVNCDGELHIIAFGDSITAGVGDSKRSGYPGRLKNIFPHAQVRNLGVPGEGTSRGRSRAQSILDNYEKTDYAIVLEGVNDYFDPTRSAFHTRDNLLSIIREADQTGGVSLLAKLTAVRRDYQAPWVSAVNSAISRYADLDFYSLGTSIIGGDRLHPSTSGYDKMAKRAAAELRDESEDNRPRDTDGDGVYDYEEQRLGTNRNSNDSDGDGALDGVEIYVYHSNPLAVDTDGDGLTDQYEIAIVGSDPTSPRPGAPIIDSLQALSNP